MSHSFALLMAALLGSSAAPAEPPTAAPAPPPPVTPDATEIIVQARSDAEKADQRERSRAAFRSLAKPVPQGGFEAQFARWEQPVCVGVAGMEAQAEQFLADRVGQIARDIGVGAQGPGCKANILIIVTHDPGQFVRHAHDSNNGLLAGLGAPVTHALIYSRDPIRWAGLAGSAGSRGDAVISTGARYGELRNVPGSRIVSSTKAVLQRMVVIVDARQVQGISMGTLSAYLAMVSLAQLRPNPDAQMVNTVLSTFRDRDNAPPDLTDFDKAYLKALYTMREDSYGAMQRQQIIGSITDSLAAGGARP